MSKNPPMRTSGTPVVFKDAREMSRSMWQYNGNLGRVRWGMSAMRAVLEHPLTTPEARREAEKIWRGLQVLAVELTTRRPFQLADASAPSGRKPLKKESKE